MPSAISQPNTTNLRPKRRKFGFYCQSVFEVFWPAGWWWVLALLVGAAFAFATLRGRATFPLWSRWVMSILRGLVAALLVILASNLKIARLSFSQERPTIAIAVDNSASIAQDLKADTTRLRLQIDSLRSALASIGFAVQQQTFTPDSAFRHPYSNLEALTNEATASADASSLRGVVLISDGRQNRGNLLSSFYSKLPIFTVGLGDSTNKADHAIHSIVANNLEPSETQIPVRVVVSSQALAAHPTELIVEVDGKIVYKTSLTFPTSFSKRSVQLNVQSGKEGTRTITARLRPDARESYLANNTVAKEVRVYNKKTKILLLSAGPHPDIKAIKSSLAQLDNVEVTTQYAFNYTPPNVPFDIAILHGLPASNFPNFKVQQLGAASLWYIHTPGTAFNSLATGSTLLRIAGYNGQQVDEAKGKINPQFALFNLAPVAKLAFQNLPPLSVPFGKYLADERSFPLFSQQIGATTNGKPLWLFGQIGTKKQTETVGEGIWKWRLAEAMANQGTATNFDYLIKQTILYLRADELSKPFQVRPNQSIIPLGAPAVFFTKLQDATGQLTDGGIIQFSISKAGAKPELSTFTYFKDSPEYTLQSLPVGQYIYKATTILAGQSYSESGSFQVVPTQDENNAIGANFVLLRQLSSNTGGSFLPLSRIGSLPNILPSDLSKPILKQTRETSKLLDLPWYISIIIGLFFAELILRKALGGL